MYQITLQRKHSTSLPPQLFQQLDLARVIQIVRGDTRKNEFITDLAPLRRSCEIARRETLDALAQHPVHLIEQLNIRSPFLLRRGLWTREPVGSLERERAARLSREAPRHGVLPVCGVNNELPDVVAALRGAPRRLLQGKSTNRAAEIGTVPRSVVVSLINAFQQQLDFAGFSQRASPVQCAPSFPRTSLRSFAGS